jgi:phosphatidate cytidylyltransferase
MKNEFLKRLITSTFLLILMFFCILYSQIVFLSVISIILYLCFVEWNKINAKYFSVKKKNSNFFLIKFVPLLFLLFVWYSAFSLRGENFETAIFFIIILFICICSDVGGYFFGKLIGGKKLTKISPNKTISGSFGSFIFSLIPILLLNMLKSLISILDSTSFDLSFKNIFFCLIVSLICQIGDLFISFFKRLNKVKDTGKILPGHGGILDRIDGIIFAIPAVFILITLKVF